MRSAACWSLAWSSVCTSKPGALKICMHGGWGAPFVMVLVCVSPCLWCSDLSSLSVSPVVLQQQISLLKELQVFQYCFSSMHWFISISSRTPVYAICFISMNTYQVMCVHTHAMHSLSVCNSVFLPLAIIYPKIVSVWFYAEQWARKEMAERTRMKTMQRGKMDPSKETYSSLVTNSLQYSSASSIWEVL